MNEEYIIEQRLGNKSSGANIGVQNVYNGISLEKAVEITNKLFIDNFPKLQEYAKEEINKRILELQEKVFRQLENNKIVNFNAFADPDMQYAYYEAQKNYARFGTEDMLSILSDLIVKRVENTENDYLKRVIDSAITIVGQLTKSQIDYLTVIFLLKNVKINSVNNIEKLKELFDEIQEEFSPVCSSGISMLISLGCLEINLGEVEKTIAKTYGLNIEEIKAIIPKEFNLVPADYSTSDIGRVISIINAQNKLRYSFMFETFIH